MPLITSSLIPMQNSLYMPWINEIELRYVAGQGCSVLKTDDHDDHDDDNHDNDTDDNDNNDDSQTSVF